MIVVMTILRTLMLIRSHLVVIMIIMRMTACFAGIAGMDATGLQLLPDGSGLHFSELHMRFKRYYRLPRLL
ncbi:hypothetical protein D3C86_1603190 [compost metagenome]